MEATTTATPTPTAFRLSDATPLVVTSSFILPEDERPVPSETPLLSTIPMIDLSDQDILDGVLVQKIAQACQEYGFFHVINHGVPEELCQRMLGVITEFFQLPPEERAQLHLPTDQTKALNYYLATPGREKVRMWSECLSHTWHPLDDFTHALPRNPAAYRETMTEYAKEIGKLMERLLGLVSTALGLQHDCLQRRMGEGPRFRAQANFYPPCPHPDLTLGLPAHTDLNALTILLQTPGVAALQVIKDGKWMTVQPVPNSLVVNLGDQIQVLTNGRFKSVHHRAATSRAQRVSLAMFYGPNANAVMSPIEDCVDEEHPPMYRSYRFSEFLEEFQKQEGRRRTVTEIFHLPNKVEEAFVPSCG